MTIPSGVRSIGNDAFYYCSSLESVKMPSSVAFIGDRAFGSCRALKSIVIPEGVAAVSNEAFYGCTSLKSIVIPDSVKTIGKSAFQGCTSLESVTIPDGVKSIGSKAFISCESLKSLTVPGSVTEIGEEAIGYVTAIKGPVTKKAGFVIRGEKGSAAAAYAKRNGFTFKVVHIHTYKTVTTKATLTKNGKVVEKCACGKVKSTTVIYAPKTIKLAKTALTYNGKVQTPSVTVKDSKGKALKKGTDYTVKYQSGRKLPGKYTVTITFKGKYSGTKKLSFTIKPAAPTGIKAGTNTSAVKLIWNKTPGADGYRVYQYNAATKTWVKVATLTDTGYMVRNLKPGTTYQFKVIAYKMVGNTALWGNYSAVVKATTKK